METIKQALLNADNEATRAPYWMILNPRQNMDCCIHNLASMLTGPFFCREDAEKFLKGTRYNFGARAAVYCLSGCNSRKYDQLYEAIEKEIK